MTTPIDEHVKPTNVKELLAYLANKFPLCFSLQGEARPLKVGIFQDLAERLKDDDNVSKTQLRQALRVYTSSWRYLEATKAGVARIDLDGTAGELIDQQQAEHASITLEQSKAKAAEVRKAKLQEARARQQTDKKPPYKKNPNKTSASPSKKTDIKNNTSKPVSKPAVKELPPLQSLTSTEIKTGDKVLVKLGQAPMLATVLEVHREDVTVQLGSGMVVKTRQDSLYQA
ncbi:RNA chaperone ProQ [Chromatiaceae bacterium AAb-1]|jgi:ProP effector|nr:RNA chaperone ProQ [Chromatiaceae bacterium AAb-1]